HLSWPLFSNLLMRNGLGRCSDVAIAHCQTISHFFLERANAYQGPDRLNIYSSFRGWETNTHLLLELQKLAYAYPITRDDGKELIRNVNFLYIVRHQVLTKTPQQIGQVVKYFNENYDKICGTVEGRTYPWWSLYPELDYTAYACLAQYGCSTSALQQVI